MTLALPSLQALPAEHAPRNAYKRAAADLVQAIRAAPTWAALAWHDVRQRYRRSLLGPLWITLSMGITVAALGFVYARLFGQTIDSYLPFVAIGFIVWGLVASLVNEGCAAFISADSTIRQVRLPLCFHVMRMMCRNLIVFAHNLLIYLVVLVVFPVSITAALPLAIVGIGLVLANGLWLGVLLGMLSTRYRDVPQIIASVVQVAFFITPIVWQPNQLSRGASGIVAWNPFYYFVEVVRAPLLGQVPALSVWMTCVAITLAGSAVSFVLFARYRARIALWV